MIVLILFIQFCWLKEVYEGFDLMAEIENFDKFNVTLNLFFSSYDKHSVRKCFMNNWTLQVTFFVAH